MARQVKTWSRQYEASKTEEIEAMNEVMDWLPKNVPKQIKNSVVHGDFRVDNLIYDQENPEKVLPLFRRARRISRQRQCSENNDENAKDDNVCSDDHTTNIFV